MRIKTYGTSYSYSYNMNMIHDRFVAVAVGFLVLAHYVSAINLNSNSKRISRMLLIRL